MFTVVLLFLLSLVAAGQTTVALEKFTGIESSLLTVKLEPADKNELSGENLSNISYRISGGQLYLENNSGQQRSVTVKFNSSLTAIKMRDMGKLESAAPLTGQNITIMMADVTKANLKLDYQTVTVNTADATQVKLSGRTQRFTVISKDASQVLATTLVAQEVSATSEDAAKVRVNAMASLSAIASDVSSITYMGSPTVKAIKTNDVGKVRPDNGNTNEVGTAVPDMPVVPPVIPDVTVTIDGQESDDSDDDEMVVTTRNHDGDTNVVRFRLKNMRITIDEDEKEKKVYDPSAKRSMKKVWAGFEIGVNGFTEPFMDFSMPAAYKPLEVNYGKSWFFGLNLFESDIHLVRNKLALSTGLGIEWSNYRFTGSTVLAPDTDSLQFTSLATGLKNNRLKTFTFTVPVLLKWAPGSASDKNDGFHIAAGVLLDYTPGVFLKTESTANGYREKAKVFDDFNTNPFRVTGTVRIGYDYLRLFVNYGLTPYFKRDAGPDFRQFQAGITLIPFS